MTGTIEIAGFSQLGTLVQEAADFEFQMVGLAAAFGLSIATVTERFGQYWHSSPYSWRFCIHLVSIGAVDAVRAIEGQQ